MMNAAARLRGRRAIAASTHKSAATIPTCKPATAKRCIVPDAKHDSTDETFCFGRIFQAAAQRVLHPCARRLCSEQHRIAAAVADQRAVLRIPNEQHSADIMPRQISAHIEFAGVSWWRDWLRSSKKFQIIAKLRRAFPTDLPDCVCGFVFAFEFN